MISAKLLQMTYDDDFFKNLIVKYMVKSYFFGKNGSFRKNALGGAECKGWRACSNSSVDQTPFFGAT